MFARACVRALFVRAREVACFKDMSSRPAAIALTANHTNARYLGDLSKGVHDNQLQRAQPARSGDCRWASVARRRHKQRDHGVAPSREVVEARAEDLLPEILKGERWPVEQLGHEYVVSSAEVRERDHLVMGKPEKQHTIIWCRSARGISSPTNLAMISSHKSANV